MLEGQPHEVQPGLLLHDAPVVDRVAVFAEYRQPYPGEIRPEARGPDHRVYVEDPTVFEARPAVRGAFDRGHPDDAGAEDVLGPEPDQGGPASPAALLELAAEPGLRGQYVAEDPSGEPAAEKGDAAYVPAESHTRRPAATNSTEISAPELPAPTTRTSPAGIWAGFR